ncbi:hypothetical protein [Salidesulfovibrio brasiliensis]|uniref:hypothetical protein n=1 Tax=Salidesulfovibrio brasiliensis TaxID=221711 RepID=UPI00155DCCD2
MLWSLKSSRANNNTFTATRTAMTTFRASDFTIAAFSRLRSRFRPARLPVREESWRGAFNALHILFRDVNHIDLPEKRLEHVEFIEQGVTQLEALDLRLQVQNGLEAVRYAHKMILQVVSGHVTPRSSDQFTSDINHFL